jgi:hypothetical protein
MSHPERPMTSNYVRVLALWLLVLAALYALQEHFS